MDKYKKTKRKGNSLLTFVGVLLILAALALLAINPIKDYLIDQGTKENAIANMTRNQIESNQQKDVTFDFDDVSNLNAYDVIKNNVNPKDLPTIGAIAIPNVKMNLPIYKGVSDAGMYLGAGTLRPDVKMGNDNYAIASHHTLKKGYLFEPLLRVKNGDLIYLTDLDSVYVYKVFYKEVLDPTRVDVIDPTSDPIVTLVTCATGENNFQRLVVQGSLVEKVAIKDANKDMIKAFDLKQNNVAN
ncbi:class A sortase [Vaginisenegalia massiliensis]|uniref:class A sortase n=1 Tax=Vaginisenegalia massiliensis TaxID=2058294 RepID=UPI001F151728|nr:class A sortase [Vaginisenegalia massiliensis]